MSTGADTNILAMSDDDFGNLTAPPAPAGEVVETPPEAEEQPAAAEAAAEETPSAAVVAEEDETPPKDTSKDGNLPNDESEQPNPADAATSETPPAAAGKDEAGKEVKKDDATPPSGSETAAADTPPDYKAMYETLMAPLKANGKTIELKSPQDAIQLMQMGANYTRKMQAIAPHRKVLMMLENSGLLDEGRLSSLIDLDKNRKNPEVIKKLLKDAGIDPLDIDMKVDSTHREGNHGVSDAEADFVAALDDVKSLEGGTDTLNVINTQWDQASKEVLWKSPEVIAVINEQRGNGMYDRISAEIDRQRVLGILPANVPFIHAYKKVGDELAAAGAFADLDQKSAQKPAATPVAKTVQTPKPAVANGGKASAAASTRSTPKPAAPIVNVLAMSDEDFLKLEGTRL